MLAGIRWTAGLVDGPTAPNPELSAAQDAKAKSDCAAFGVTEVSIAEEEAAKAKKRAEQEKKKKAAAK